MINRYLHFCFYTHSSDYSRALVLLLFCFYDTATSDIYTLSLHDALPISAARSWAIWAALKRSRYSSRTLVSTSRSEEHTSELQSHHDLVCRLLLEKKKTFEVPASGSTTLLCTSSLSTTRLLITSS